MNDEPSNPPEMRDALDELLAGGDDYVADDGFTSRVIAELPRRKNASWWRFALLALAALLGVGLASCGWPEVYGVFKAAVVSLRSFHWQSAMLLVPLFLALVAMAWGVIAIVSEDE